MVAPAFMSTQLSHHEQAVSLGPLSLSLPFMCPIPALWALTSLLPIMMKSLSLWRTVVMQTLAQVEAGSLPLFSRLMAFGQWLPALAPLLCSKVWCPKVLAHHPLHVISISSLTWLLNRIFQPWSLHIISPISHSLYRLIGREPTPCCSLSSLTQHRTRWSTTHSPGQLCAICLHGTSVSYFSRKSIPLIAAQPFLDWSLHHPSQQQYPMPLKGSPCLRTAVNFLWSSPPFQNFL